jgi:hypothetical protein
MALPRKRGLKRLHSFASRVEEHLAKIRREPTHEAVLHWMGEIDNWLGQMEELLPHVGQKTAREWQARIRAFRSALEG